MPIGISANPHDGKAFQRAWRILKQENPASAIDALAITINEHRRNCQLWMLENPLSTADPNIRNAVELRRFFQRVYPDL